MDAVGLLEREGGRDRMRERVGGWEEGKERESERRGRMPSEISTEVSVACT